MIIEISEIFPTVVIILAFIALILVRRRIRRKIKIEVKKDD
jgi:hypothetical protein